MLASPPAFGTRVQTAAPPISGGTLLILHDHSTAVAADSDRDRVMIVDVPTRAVHAVALSAHDEPGRLVEDAAGRVHVALRSGGAVVTLDPVARVILARRAVCSAPRGLVYQPETDSIHVACAGGELVTLPAGGGDATRVLHLERDLRDVVLDGNRLLVSRFRSAQLLVVDAGGQVTGRLSAANLGSGELEFEPAVAWKTVAWPSGGALMLHQRGVVREVPTSTAGYGSQSEGCTSTIVHTTVSRLAVDGSQVHASPVIPAAVVAVDLALSPDASQIAVVSAGNSLIEKAPQLAILSVEGIGMGDPCIAPEQLRSVGQPVAVAYLNDHEIVVQSREPPLLHLVRADVTISLPGDSRADTGHNVFHSNSGAGLACASCHPEGGEDGRTWHFLNQGARRTQSLRGGIASTAPFHWDGVMTSFSMLVGDVFEKRMSGPQLTKDQLAALNDWIETVPSLPATTAGDASSVERGRQLFQDTGVACASCHSGTLLTNNKSVDVGTGGTFQVPSMRGVAWRAPFLHSGCAPTLRDRFGACGGAQHGDVSALSGVQLDDLVHYLETL